MTDLADLIDALEAIAPLEYAEPWDNVGLLVEPPDVGEIGALMLTIDLTEPVLDEALDSGADAIVAYHPTIFGGVKRLTQRTAQARTLMTAIRAGVPIYSPHTALDAAPNGMNDWLAEGLGHAETCRPIKPFVGRDGPISGVGAGRTVTLNDAASLDVVVETMKAHLGLEHVRVAAPEEFLTGERWVGTAAVCPGAGGSVFEAVGEVDLLVTGEMRHHDVLARVAAGTAVLLTDHTNTERGYLPRFKQRLTRLLGEHVEVLISKRDADPLSVR